MSVPMILRPEAETDLRNTYFDLENAHAGLGARFLVAVGEVLDRIEWLPEIYGVMWDDGRAARLKRFRYVVLYLVNFDQIEVLAVFHGSRDSGEWHSRR